MAIVTIEIHEEFVFGFEPWRDAVRDVIPHWSRRESTSLVAHPREAYWYVFRVPR